LMVYIIIIVIYVNIYFKLHPKKILKLFTMIHLKKLLVFPL
ncbi:hypothetical protein HMPREF9418_3002, partial [Neisseria macacae ATCC 33926]